MLSTGEDGLGNDLVAFGTMRNVDAGATIFLGWTLAMVRVYASGSKKNKPTGL